MNKPTEIWSLDVESFSAGGYVWKPDKNRWGSLAEGRKGGIAVIGAAAYAAHPSTEILMLSYGPSEWTKSWMLGQPAPQDLCDHIEAGGLISGQNVMFEFWTWNECLAERHGWPRLEICQLIDAAALCRAYGAPGKLQYAGEMLLPPEQRKKESLGAALIRKFSIPQNPTQKEPERRRIHLHDSPAQAAEFLLYNQYDKIAENALLLKCPPLIPEERRMWEIDAHINDRGISVDVPAMKRCLEWTNYHTLVGNAELSKITGGAVNAASEVTAMCRWLESCGLKVKRTRKGEYNLDDKALRELLDKPVPPHLRRVLELRQNLAGAAVKKLFAMDRMLCPDNRLRGMFEYWGAHTARWAGRGVQLHNFPKDTLSPPKGWDYDAYVQHVIFNTELSMQDVKACLRGLLVAGPGTELISSDYNAIEAVVAAVLAQEDWRLEVFRTHGKIYEESASRITGVPFEEFMQHKRDTGEHHPLRNKIGKYAELASGFGGWINAWLNFGAGKHLTEPEIKQHILAWRKASPKIVEMWGGQWRQLPGYRNFRRENYGLEGAWVNAIFNPNVPQQVGKYLHVTYFSGEDVMRILLPSGRSLTYREPRLSPGIDNFSKNEQWELSYLGYREGKPCRIKTYGGKLFENVVQAVARDRLRDAMILLEDNHYPVVLHVHDEPTSEVAPGFGSVEEYEQIITATNSWCRSFHEWPIRASGGWRGLRYRK